MVSKVTLIGAVTFCLLTLSSSGVAQIYLHDDKVQKITDGVQAGFKAASPTAVFDDQAKFFTSLSNDEQSWVRNSVISRRDLALIVLIKATQSERLRVISDHMAQLIDADVFTDATKLQKLAILDEQLKNARGNIAQDQTSVSQSQTEYIRAGGDAKHSACADVKPSNGIWPTTGAPLTAPVLDQYRQQLQVMCGVLERHMSGADQFTAIMPTTGASKIATALTALKQQQQELKDQQAQAANLKSALAQIQKAIDDPQSSSETSKFARDLLVLCAADPSASASKTAAGAAKNNVAAGSAAPSLKGALDTCINIAATDASKLVKLAQHEFLVGQIQTVLNAVLASDSASASGATAVTPSSLAQSTVTAIKTLDLLASAADQINANARPSVNALLVALAYEQHLVAQNKLLGQSIPKRTAILEEQREALVAEISHLARALRASNRVNTSIESALPSEDAATVLTEVNAAWNTGRYRSELADFADIALIRDDALASSREIASAWSSLLQPAIAELAAYGTGGLNAQTVASFLNVLINAAGFSAVANKIH